ncbi:NlpC/P60 family protein [Aquipuribacter nitratireducens]|uniref:NlpC/P60 family protein n=1 Tax=Aquipuribacter nitratireducens TaxID=650104 RepID=A0ABW0GLV6_9MICO
MPIAARRSGVVLALLLALVAGLLVVPGPPSHAHLTAKAAAPRQLPGTTGTLRVWTSGTPAVTTVRDDRGVVATFTRGARTVGVRGPARSFAESTTTAMVTSTTWVRLLPAPFSGSINWSWLGVALQDRTPDVLAVAVQYVTGAPDVVDDTGRRVAGDASYGPLVDGARQEGSDANDFLGEIWTYPDGTTDAPEPAQLGAMDCSGFVRMVLGVRSGLPLSLRPDGQRLPRRSFEMLASGPGVVVAADTGARAPVSGLRPGDLVFFDASTDDGTRVDHVGIHLGTDSAGAPRFVSSRKTVDGPTLGDVGGRSTLSGTGLYATAFRAVRRP